jgi:hypothetical protein
MESILLNKSQIISSCSVNVKIGGGAEDLSIDCIGCPIPDAVNRTMMNHHTRYLRGLKIRAGDDYSLK